MSSDLPPMIVAIFKHFDRDEDEFLNYREFLAFLRVVNPQGAPKFDFTAFTKWCQRVKADPDKGLTVDNLYITYADLQNTEEALKLHHDKVMSSPHPDTKEAQEERVQKVISEVQRENAARGELLRRALVELEAVEERDLARNRRQSLIMRTSYQATWRRRSTLNPSAVTGMAGRPSASAGVPGRHPRASQKRMSTPGLNLGLKNITLDFITAMMDNFQAGILLDAPTVIRIVAQTITMLEALPNVVEAKVVDPAKITVVGDLHGQLEDLLRIFQLNGLPSPRNQYLFNGDWVDRGECGVEIVLIIFAFKLVYPDAIYLNRGNHEATDVNSDVDTYSMCFYKECMQKYDREIYDMFSEAFAACPLATVINGKFFVVHGGLCHTPVKVADIQKIDRFQMHPPYDTIFEDLLWSDPHNKKGIAENDRGCSILFGSQSVNRFLKEHKFSMLIRSHEKKEEGYEFMFKKKLCTVFSASNYCDEHENDGAVMVIKPNMTYKFLTWNLDPQNAEVGMFCLRYSLKQDVVLSKLVRRVSRARMSLIARWKGTNAKKPNVSIPRKEWADGLAAALRIRIDFLKFQDLLGLPKYGVNGKIGGPIDYMEFLSRFAPVSHHLQAAKGGTVELKDSLTKLSDVIASLGSNLQTLFSYFDYSGNGTVTTTEFETGLLSLGSLEKSATFTEGEVKKLTEFFDSKSSGHINFDEFFNGFSVHDPKLSSKLAQSAKSRKTKASRRKQSIIMTAPFASIESITEQEAGDAKADKKQKDKKPTRSRSISVLDPPLHRTSTFKEDDFA